MNKIITLLSLMMFTTFSFSQKGNKNCNLIEEGDKSKRIVSRSTIFETIGVVGQTGEIKFKLTQYSDKNIALRLFVHIKRFTPKNIDENSKILIRTKSGVVNLKVFEQIDTAQRRNSWGEVVPKTPDRRQMDLFADITADQSDFLLKNKMDGLRVYYSESFDEFQVSQNFKDQSDYFIKTLKCFE